VLLIESIYIMSFTTIQRKRLSKGQRRTMTVRSRAKSGAFSNSRAIASTEVEVLDGIQEEVSDIEPVSVSPAPEATGGIISNILGFFGVKLSA